LNLKDNTDRAADAGKVLRLQVYLAHGGVASRRASEKLITAGRVGINGRIVTVLGEKVLPGDRVTVDGTPVLTESRFRYLLLHKPPLYISAASDPQGRPLAKDLLPRDITERLYNVGRLDFRSSGLLIFTNDGDFAARIGHPRSNIEKEYLVETAGSVPDSVIDLFSRGLIIEGVRYQAREIERIGSRSLRIVLIEGKNREIRRIFSHFHLHPNRLHRIRIGPVSIGDLGEGETRPLTNKELDSLNGIVREEK
jgi:23S rRNA pseudouridine2605 synthase